MTEKINKMVIVPVDGSEDALKSLDYLGLYFGSAPPYKSCTFKCFADAPPDAG